MVDCRAVPCALRSIGWAALGEPVKVWQRPTHPFTVKEIGNEDFASDRRPRPGALSRSLARAGRHRGTWKIDLSKVNTPAKPSVLSLKNGMFDCKSCVPAIHIKADGTDQPVSGHPGRDTIAIEAVDDHTVKEVDKKGGTLVDSAVTTISPDGRTATTEFTGISPVNGEKATGTTQMTRVAAGAPGAHAFSGSWRTSRVQNVSDNGLTFTYALNGDMLAMTTPTGQSCSVRTDGTRGHFKGYPGVTEVAIKRLGKHVCEDTDLRDGKVIPVTRMTLKPDGKSMAVSLDDKLHGRHWSHVALKQ
jgi:hypothetical protein